MAFKQIHMLMATLAASTLVLSHALQKDADALDLELNAEDNNTKGTGNGLFLMPGEVSSYLDFLDKTYTAALRMMLPANKDTIGGHCFRYAALMAREFYATVGGPPDLLNVKGSPEIAKAFKGAAQGQRVAVGPFIDAHKALSTNDNFRAAYGAFLAAVFDAGTAMMLPDQKSDLGQHCYGYAHIFAREFYFGGNNGQDQLGLQAPLPAAKAGTPLAKVHTLVNADFSSVDKDSDGRVSRAAFKRYFLSQALAQ
jgi:hypothetical protein